MPTAMFTTDCSIREYCCACAKVCTRINGLNFKQRACTGHMESWHTLSLLRVLWTLGSSHKCLQLQCLLLTALLKSIVVSVQRCIQELMDWTLHSVFVQGIWRVDTLSLFYVYYELLVLVINDYSCNVYYWLLY